MVEFDNMVQIYGGVIFWLSMSEADYRKIWLKICGKQKNVGNICWSPTKFEFRAKKSPYVGRKVRQCTRTFRGDFLRVVRTSNTNGTVFLRTNKQMF